MTDKNCEDCETTRTVKSQMKKIERISNCVDELKRGIYGDMQKTGIKGRVDRVELVIEGLQKGIQDANDTAKKALNILIMIAVTLVGGSGVAFISFLLNLKK
jgi:hypothetical protein